MNTAHLDDLIDRFALGADLLNYATQGLSDDQLKARPGPGAWSIAELCNHLLDSDLVAADRMKRVIAEHEPVLLNYEENDWIARLNSQELPTAEAVALFVANRKWMTRILRNCQESDWTRWGTHSVAGKQTLTDLVVKYVHHVDSHLRFLYGKRGNLNTFLPPKYSQEG